MSLFDKPSGDWSDREIEVGLAELARAMQWHADQRQPGRVDQLHQVAVVLAGERDARRRLAWAVDEATNPFQVIDE